MRTFCRKWASRKSSWNRNKFRITLTEFQKNTTLQNNRIKEQQLLPNEAWWIQILLAAVYSNFFAFLPEFFNLFCLDKKLKIDWNHLNCVLRKHSTFLMGSWRFSVSNFMTEKHLRWMDYEDSLLNVPFVWNHSYYLSKSIWCLDSLVPACSQSKFLKGSIIIIIINLIIIISAAQSTLMQGEHLPAVSSALKNTEPLNSGRLLIFLWALSFMFLWDSEGETV